MSVKHLRELLKEDQEPFLLQNYIAANKLKTLQKHKKTISTTKTNIISYSKTKTPHFNFPHNCFLSNNFTPDPRKSPLIMNSQSPSANKNPIKTQNPIFLNIPAKTAALLLEAALRIQQQSSKDKTTLQVKNSNGFLGSLLKRLKKNRTTNKNRKRGIKGITDDDDRDGIRVSVKEILRWDSSVGLCKKSISERDDTGSWRCSYYYNEIPKTSPSSWSNQFEGICDYDDDNKGLCESPFRFVLRQSSFSGHRTPEFSSPAMSPRRFNAEDKVNNKHNENDVEGLKKFQVQVIVEAEEEEKQQCSPVSVLDPNFQDDDEDDTPNLNDVDDDGQNEDNDFDPNCSYAILQRAKKQLLQNLQRFEELAGLDTVELEKGMLALDQDINDDDADDDDDIEGDEEFVPDELVSSDCDENISELIVDKLGKSSLSHLGKIPEDMRALVSDLIAEEKREQNSFIDGESMAKRVSKRLESWEEVESNTIDMMVEQDHRRELGEWKWNQQGVEDTAIKIELGIFGLLVEELSQELLCFTGV